MSQSPGTKNAQGLDECTDGLFATAKRCWRLHAAFVERVVSYFQSDAAAISAHGRSQSTGVMTGRVPDGRFTGTRSVRRLPTAVLQCSVMDNIFPAYRRSLFGLQSQER